MASSIPQRRTSLLLGCVVAGVSAAVFGAPAGLPENAGQEAAACQKLASFDRFPARPSQITFAKFNPSGTTSANGVFLPAHCQIQGTINPRTGSDGLPYGDRFEVRLPVPAEWNGRFMFQGGGGTEGALPPATGTAGTLSPTLAHGWAVASQNGGHENKDLPNPLQFLLEPAAVDDHAFRSVQLVTETAKGLVDAYYGQSPDHSYFVGCSTGGRQGMMFSQNFPADYDGIVAGDPVFDLEAIALTELWGVQAMRAATPVPIKTLPDGAPILYPAFPVEDQRLLNSAILEACDALDGTIDGVVDNAPACWRNFDPATFIFPRAGGALQCSGAKTATCLSPAQIDAIKKINQGPRDSSGQSIKVPASAAVAGHVDGPVPGYAYDGGFMAPAGIPSRKIGTPTTAPGDFALGVRQIPYAWMSPADLDMNPLSFDFDKDIGRLTRSTPLVSFSASTDIAKFRDRGGKIIWYHGTSDPGPPVLGTIAYFEALAAENGSLAKTKNFARLFLVPQMGHCRGGPATDQFDMLTPLVAWVEHGTPPERIDATGRNFNSAPTTRSRPLCPYPEQARYIGPAPGDLADAANYACRLPK